MRILLHRVQEPEDRSGIGPLLRGRTSWQGTRHVASLASGLLHYTFRRYYGTTPDGYLRRVRLERAHWELLAADPASGLTVKAVAGRWGWASHSRFVVAYQQRFGVLPSRTLRS